MNREDIDRILEEGLKHYSRVTPPADFAERLRERQGQQATTPAPWLRRWWWLWAPAPVAAALLLALLWWPRPAGLPGPQAITPPAQAGPQSTTPPVQAQARRPAPRTQERVAPKLARKRPGQPLSPEELARLRIPEGLFPVQPLAEQLVVPDLPPIPELKIPALESETPESRNSDLSR